MPGSGKHPIEAGGTITILIRLPRDFHGFPLPFKNFSSFQVLAAEGGLHSAV